VSRNYQYDWQKESFGVHTDTMAESSSSGPPNGEALWLSELAIRALSPYAKHVISDTN
jgi:hypothetical protein